MAVPHEMVNRGRTDASDAEVICEAVTRLGKPFAPMKSSEQQAALALHRTRDLLFKQLTELLNMVPALLAGFGIEIEQTWRNRGSDIHG